MSPVKPPVNEGMQGENVAVLHDDLTRLGFDIAPAERDRRFFGPSTLKAVRTFQEATGLEVTGVVDKKTAAVIAERLGEGQDPPPPGPATNGSGPGIIRGYVLTADRTAVADAEVVALTVGLGHEQQIGSGTADPAGRYTVEYDRAALGAVGRGPDLRVRARRAGAEIGASDIVYNAPTEVRIDVVVATATVEAGDEHARIVQALAPHLEAAPDRQRLADLVETPERRDVTFLANKTGWDARAVAMAAAADQLSRDSDLPGELFYALFRAGLPADRAALARTRPEQVTAIWKQSIESGVIAKDLGRTLDKFAERFTGFAADALLTQPAPVGVSSLHDMLDAAGLDDAAKRQVAATYASSPDRDAFWNGVKAQLGPERAARVATAGQLGYLTVNNAPLTKKLVDMADGAHGDPVGLVKAGLYQPEAWKGLVDGAPVPAEVPGADERERKANYASLLANQIELSWPTAVVGAMVERGELPVADEAGRTEAARFLAEHQGRFELGAQPVASYLRDNDLQLGGAALASVTTLQRQYQLSPSNPALRALAAQKIDSAFAATRYSPGDFVAQFGEALGGEATARLVHAKAQQIHATTLHVATNYLMARTGPSLYAVPPTLGTMAANGNGNGEIHAAAGGSDVIAYATLEQLFDELDYCACTHCRSVLSPAAYLVDLLMFSDKRRYNAAGQELPATYAKENPLDVLLSRRPDIADLQLTCENTNVALPYIDLVNEVLEHFVVHESLAAFHGHDVPPGQDSQDLIAAPAFVDPAAYTILAGDTYPLQLPFHRPLAGLRAYIAQAGTGTKTTLADTMEALRASDALTAGGGAPYGWRDILIERLGISRAEHGLLTDGTVTLAKLYGDGGANDAAVITNIGNAKAFARRLDLSYEDVATLLRTRFVNPQAWLLPRLDRLGISFETIKAHHDGQISDAQLDAKLPPNLDTAPYGGNPKQWLADHYAAIGTLLVLRDPDGKDLCSFDTIRLQHALDGSEMTPVEARRLVRFVRLWRRLGWTFDQIDRALSALWPAAQRPAPADNAATAAAKLDAGFADVLLRLGHLHRAMDLLGLSVQKDLARALALWAPIDTMGSASLYHRMFLAPSILAIDPVFAENPSGEVLTAAADLGDHRPAIEAACNLKGGELGVILTAAGFDDQTDLTVANLSTVFRWAFLARRLKLSLAEVVALRDMTGLDVFAEPSTPAPPASPVPPLIRFVELAQRLKDAGVKVALLMYLFRHELPKGAPDPAEVLAQAKAVHDDLARIEQENALVDDPDGEIARAKLALLYGQPVADRFMAMVTGTSPLDQEFLDAQPELATLYTTVTAHPAAERAGAVLAPLLPGLRRHLQELRLLQVLAADSDDMTPEDIGLLVRDPAVLHRAGGPGATTAPVIDDLRGVAQAGASMAVYDGATATGNPSTRAATVDPLDYSEPAHPLPANSQNAAGPVSGVWRGYLDPPANGGYRFTVEADSNSTVALRIAGHDVALTHTGGTGTWEAQAAVDLKAGTPVELRLTVENVRHRMALQWRSPALAREVVPAARLLPGDLVDAFAVGYVRLLKAFGLAAQLDLDGAELARFAAHPALAIGGAGWLNALPVPATVEATTPPPVPAAATLKALVAALTDLVGYAGLRRDLKVRDHALVDLLADPDALTSHGTSVRSRLTGWADAEVSAVLTHLNLAESDLGRVDALRRVQRVFDQADTLGVPAPTLLDNVTNDPTADQWSTVQAALRARYDDDTWPGIIQPVNDSLRDQQRDALVAHVLHHLRSQPATAHIDTANKLFEWFLLDVEMEPCMQTSRIRQALSSVQLFIQRSLLNLEPRVAASSIDPRRWSWMQRYRVWEANRKVFLMPENWLEPELRDDKSPLFRQLEGELLAGDITDEAAATALGHYLAGLAEVATLEVTGMFVEEGDPGAADDIVHVVGRTAGARRRYHYRRQSRGAWTAWEPVPLDIEDTPVLPVVWQGRLLLFWLRVMDGAPAAQSATTATTDKALPEVRTSEIRTTAPRRVHAMLQWSEFFNGAWQPARTSDPNAPVLIGDVAVDAFDRNKLHMSTSESSDGSLVVDITYDNKGATFRLYTPHSLPVRGVDEPTDNQIIIVFLFEPTRDFQTDKGLTVSYFNPLEGPSMFDWSFTHDVLRRGYHGRVVEPRHPLRDLFSAPFFYQDRRHVLYVRPATSIVRVPEFVDIGVQPEPPRVRVPELPPVHLIPERDLKDLIPHVVDPYPPEVYHGGFAASPPGAHVINTNIRTEIGAVGTFMFGDQVIAPGGALAVDEMRGMTR